MRSVLLGVTYSEFDNTVGPKLLYTYPLEVMSKERFEELSDYVIVGKHLCKKIIVVKNDDIQYMNYSVAIDNPKYDRNSLLFSLGFILAKGIETEPFEPILRKLSLAFLALENESEFLFVEITKNQIQDVLKRLYEDLITKGETFIDLDESNVLTAKIFEAPKEPIEILDYNVPVLRYGRISQLNIPWDISLNYLLGRIDGISHIKKIASKKPPIDIECVRRCLRTLLFYDCVIISHVMNLSNVYQLEKAAKNIIADTLIMTDIQSFCCFDTEAPPNINNIIRFLLKFRPGKQLGHILISAGVDLLTGIDVRRLLSIAQDFKLITRLHEYPVYMFKQRVEGNVCGGSGNDVKNIAGVFKSSVTGNISTSQMCINPVTAPLLNAIKNRKLSRQSDITSTGHFDAADGSTPDLSAVLCSLKGDVSLDSICCAYDIVPSEIIESQKYHIVYK